MTNYKVVQKIARKGYPTISREYVVAHAEADNEEKKKYPKGYKKLKVIDDKLSSKQLIGKNSKIGKITVASKVPKKLRNEVAFHESVEHKAINRLKKKL